MTLLATVGAIEGGWSYVIAAYAVTWIMLGGYAVSLVVRARSNSEPPHESQ